MKVWIIELEFKNGETEIFEVHGSVMSAMKRCSEINKRGVETIIHVYMSELEVVNDDHGLMDLDEFQDFVEELEE